MKKTYLTLLFNPNGFSLIEVMISLSIMLIIFGATTRLSFGINQLAKRVNGLSDLSQEANLLTGYLTNQVRDVGGGNIRPYMALWVENNCAASGPLPNCQGSDRLTIIERDSTQFNCTVDSAQLPARLNFQIVNSTCCAETINQRHILLLQNGQFGQFFARDTLFDEASNECWADIEAGQASGVNALTPPLDFTDWSNSQVFLVNPKTIYLNSTSHELRVFSDINNNQTIDSNEDHILGDRIYDIQYMLGYDAPPIDGIISGSNDDNDEWLYNSNGVNEAMGAGGLTSVPLQSLRVIGIGLMIGNPLVKGAEPIQLFDGPQRVETIQLQTIQSRTYLRSALVYNN